MTDSGMTLRAYLVDDEPLALRRLGRLLHATGRVELLGSTTDPYAALRFLGSESVDLLFLDIQMPGMNGFELLSKLAAQPMVIFTTAYDEFALKAFGFNSIDYLLKPVEPRELDRALKKVEQLWTAGRSLQIGTQLQSLVMKLADKIAYAPREFQERISTRSGDRITFIELDKITHFFAEDKLTYAATDANRYIVDYTIAELEQKLRARGFARIHRATLVNLNSIDELYRWFGGRMLIRMKDKNRTELTVSREHARSLKERLGLQ